MSKPQPTTGGNPSDNLSCPHCNAILPSRAVSCSSCGERVNMKNRKPETQAENVHDEAQEQEAKTIRLSSLPQIYLKRWLSYQSLKNNNHSGRSQGSSPSLQDAEEVPTQPISSLQEMASADETVLLVAPIQIERTQASPTMPAPSIPKASELTPIRSNLLWPSIIIISAVAAGLVYFVFTNTIVRPAVVFWFLFICPGMMVVRFLRLKEPIVEWTLALALSFAIDAIVAAIQLYAGRWSPAGTLTILMILSLCGAIVQLVTSTKSVPILLRTVRSRKPGVLLPILLTLLVGIIVGMSIWSYEVYHSSGSATSTSALPRNATPHSSPQSTVVPTPSSTSSAHIAELYHGTIYEISANVTTEMSLTGIQQTQITIGGNFTGLHRTGTFNGIVDPSKHIQFTVKDSAGHLILSFDGAMQSDGDLSGSYCSVDQDAQCTGEYGLWSVTPAS
jgi:hypothetical protein